MTERVIRITRDLYLSLPALYQNIAEIGKQNGKVLIVEEHDIPKLPKKTPKYEMPSSCKKSFERNIP
jgi:hypothetical protein